MRWPGNFLLPVLAVLSACASPILVAGDEVQRKPAVTDADPAKPMVTQNPGGTITVQKQAPKIDGGDARVKKGLIIPPQVVVPITPPPAR